MSISKLCINFYFSLPFSLDFNFSYFKNLFDINGALGKINGFKDFYEVYEKWFYFIVYMSSSDDDDDCESY